MKAVQKDRRQGRSERGGEAYFELYVEPPSERERSLRAFFQQPDEPEEAISWMLGENHAMPAEPPEPRS